jgi:nucleotide-binding universal stress UspA family protein
MKKILVPTDFSQTADAALDFAVNLAQKYNAHITLLHAVYTAYGAEIRVTNASTYIDTAFDTEKLRAEIANFETMCKDRIAKAHYPLMTYQIASGKVVPTTTGIAQDEGYDLIVMGTRGDAHDDEWFVGSNAEKIVRTAHCPVLSIRRKLKHTDIKKIVLACDLEAKKDLPIETIKTWQTLFEADLNLVYVNTPINFTTTREIHRHVHNFAKKYTLDNYTFHLYCDYTEDDGINHFAESIDADLIIVISERKQGFARLLSGSVSEGVVYGAKIPVLTIGLNK